MWAEVWRWDAKASCRFRLASPLLWITYSGKFSWKEQRFLIWRLILDIYLDLRIFTLDLKGELLWKKLYKGQENLFPMGCQCRLSSNHFPHRTLELPEFRFGKYYIFRVTNLLVSKCPSCLWCYLINNDCEENLLACCQFDSSRNPKISTGQQL